MKTSSAKAKGRRLQQAVATALLEIGRKYGLVADDIVSRGMGQNGVDVILSPAAQRVFPLAVECKNQEALNVVGEFVKFWQDSLNQKNPKFQREQTLKVLIHSRNRLDNTTGPLVTMRLKDFASMMGVLVTREEWRKGLNE